MEFALVLPILIMLLIGTISTGVSYSHALGVTNAVREGARFAATTPYPPPAGNWVNDVLTRTATLQFDDPAGATKVCVRLYKQGTGPLAGDCNVSTDPEVAAVPEPAFTPPANMAAGSCVVRVWAARKFVIDAVLYKSGAKFMTRQSVALYERQPCGT